MKAIDILQRLEQMDQLIRLKATGNSREFALCATVAFASSGDPVKEEGSKVYQFQTVAVQACQSDGEAQCVYCASCNGTIVCVWCSCGNCNPAWEALQSALCSLGCCQD